MFEMRQLSCTKCHHYQKDHQVFFCYPKHMLRDNTESFAPEFADILLRLGVEEDVVTTSFQLLKFERLEPDLFVWLLRGTHTYLMTIADGGSDMPNSQWLAQWAGVATNDLSQLSPQSTGLLRLRGMKDGYDFVHVYQLPAGYEYSSDYHDKS